MRVFAQSIVETIRQPLVLLDGLLRVKVANPAFFDTFRLPEAETRGRFFCELDQGLWDTPRLRTLLQEVQGGGSFKDFEVQLDFPRLGRRVMLLDGRQIRGEDGRAMVLLAMEDVTEKNHARDELERLNRELENRVEERTAELLTTNKELEAFCYSVSHDLRAPLRVLDGFSEELLRNYSEGLDDKGQHYLRRLRMGTQRMGQLIDDLLQLSRLSRGEMRRERIQLTTLAQIVAAELSQREPDRKVTFDIQPGLIAIGDPGLLKVVLENLLSNAWKFTGKKSSATITVGRTEHQSATAFFVRDDGVGFDMNHADMLFGAFQRLHPQRDFPGNGIGLATVQRIIHRHGGKVWAESPAGMGATFYFTLPMKEQP